MLGLVSVALIVNTFITDTEKAAQSVKDRNLIDAMAGHTV